MLLSFFATCNIVSVRSLFYFVDVHLTCLSRSRNRLAVPLYLSMSIYYSLLIIECCSRANFASSPIYFVFPHSSLFVACSVRLCNANLSLCVDGSSRRSVVIRLCLYVDVCLRVVNYNTTGASHC